MEVNCCDSIADTVYNPETLLKARRDGLSEDEAYDAAYMGSLCTHCMTWYEQNDSGKLFAVHVPTGKNAEL